jgi:hypothetical protein
LFLSNVSSEAISSKVAKKTLVQHLSSVLDANASPPEKVESIRFRSVAFSTGSMPKRAAYITKQLMESTTKSTNAYAVFSTAAAARKAASQLNGTEVLNRHVRVDSVTHPSPVDHLRCVFVGNLGFVDDETVVSTNADGETTEKKRNKTPSDVEEGLWRTFGTQGKVESVRVVRDPQTRVGKGFAYVQFYVSDPFRDINILRFVLIVTRMPTALSQPCCWTGRSSLPCSPANSACSERLIRARLPWPKSVPARSSLPPVAMQRAQSTRPRLPLSRSLSLAAQANCSVGLPLLHALAVDWLTAEAARAESQCRGNLAASWHRSISYSKARGHPLKMVGRKT